MNIIVNSYEELTDVVGWVYFTNKWNIGQTRIIIHNVGDISYTQLISGNVHLRFPVLVSIEPSRVWLYRVEGVPEFLPDLSYDDWDDLFN